MYQERKMKLRTEASIGNIDSIGKSFVASRTSEPSVSPIDAKVRAPAFAAQGYNGIVEILFSGEISAGKLLMHFLLYYGQHFDA